MTLQDCIKDYEDEFVACQRKSRAWQYFAKELVTIFSADAHISEVASAASVRRWMAHCNEAKNSAATIKTKLSFLNSLCRLATENGVAAKFPRRLSAGIKVDNKRTRTLSKKELEVLRSVMSKEDWGVCVFAMRSGLRSQEVFLLELADVDFKARTMRIRKTKTGLARTVPMHPDIHAMAVAAARGRRRYVVNPSGYDNWVERVRMGEAWKQEVFRVALRKAGIKNFRWHDWRHQAATTMVENGGCDVAICDIMGWKDPRHLLRYANLKMKTLHKTMSLA